jgi:hypothetical protein
VVGPRCRGDEGTGTRPPIPSAALATLYPSQRPWRLKYAVRAVVAALFQYRFVLKTDVKSYYAPIDHQLLLDRLAVHIGDHAVLT